MKLPVIVSIVATAVLASGAVVYACASSSNDEGKQRAALARGLLDTVFNQRKVKEGFDQYVGATYKQHNPYAADGKQAAVDFLGKFMASGAEYHYDIKNVYVDGKIAIVHSHVTRGAADRGSAVIDIFRFDDHDKIVEHWDVLQAVPEKSANDNTMF